MLWTIVAVLLVLWLLGFSLHIAGGLIHLLLVVALVMIVINLISGRRTAWGAPEWGRYRSFRLCSKSCARSGIRPAYSAARPGRACPPGLPRLPVQLSLRLQRLPPGWDSWLHRPRCRSCGFESSSDFAGYFVWAPSLLFVLEQAAKATACRSPQESQSGLAGALGTLSFGGCQTSGDMRLVRRVSRHQRALLLRLGSAHRARHGQYPSLREWPGLHTLSIHVAGFRKWSILLVCRNACAKTGI